jgi:hypothetical protein
MGILDEIMNMQNKGQNKEEITQTLREKGVSPKEIEDSFNQIKIKNAISNQDDYVPQNQQEEYIPQQKEETQEQQIYTPQEYQNQDQYSNQQEPYEEYSSENSNTGIMIEIAEQVFLEKIEKIEKQMENFTEFKTNLQSKTNDLSNRLKRIETTIDKLQISILNKIGSYGENLNSIKKEMSMMQNSFGKIVNKVNKN